MEHEQIERLIREFLGQNQGRSFCTKCLMKQFPTTASEDEIAVEKVLCNTMEGKKRRKLGRCYACLAIAETVAAEK